MFHDGFSLSRTVLDDDEMMFLKIALAQYNDVENIQAIKNRIFQKLSTKNFYNPYYIKQPDIEDLDIDSLFIERLENAIKSQEIAKLTLQHKTTQAELYKIANFNGFWYLFAKDLSDAKVKTFKLSEIKKLTPLGQYYKTTPQQIEEILQNAHSAFYQDGNSFEVVVKVDKESAIYFKSKDFLESQEILEEREDGSLVVKFEVSHDEDIDNVIKAWLPHIEVLEPQRFREKLLNELKNYVEMFGTK